MPKEHVVIFFPGLSNDTPFFHFAVDQFNQGHIESIAYTTKWTPNAHNFEEMLKDSTALIKTVRNHDKTVSVCGSSAGSALALTLKGLMPKDVLKAASIGGALSTKDPTDRLKKNFEKFPAHLEAVRYFEKEIEPKLTSCDRSQILTLRPLWDETVPPHATVLEGAQNRVIPMIEHSLANSLTLLFDPRLKRFLSS
jgi:hypothetical protein